MPEVRQDELDSRASFLLRKEEQVQEALGDIRRGAPREVQKIRNMRWMKDGIDAPPEFLAAMNLIYLADKGFADDLVNQSWVAEGLNLAALESLGYMAQSDPTALSSLMAHSFLADGISEQEARALAVMHSSDDSIAREALLEQATFEERTITLPLAGETRLTIVRTLPGSDYVMDFLERSVRDIEAYMGYPFPRKDVYLWFNTIEERTGGVFHSTHVSIVDDEFSDPDRLFRLIAHEIGHYYWSGGPHAWRNEGGAHLMSSVVTNKLQGSLLSPPCKLARTIAEFEELPYAPGSFDYGDCWPALGERLLRDLHRSLDGTTFRQALRRLYLHTVYGGPSECGQDEGICLVREAFMAYLPEEQGLVGRLVDRWYDGTEPYDLSAINESINPSIPTVDGQIENASISKSAGGPSISTLVRKEGQIGAIHLNLDYAWKGTPESEFLPVSVDIFYEDGLPLRRELIQLPLPPGKSSYTHSHWMNESEAFGAHWIVVRQGEQKIAQVSFESTLLSTPYNIAGSITDTEGQRNWSVKMSAVQGKEVFITTTQNIRGEFWIPVPAGTFVLEVHVPSNSIVRFVGWYDGEGRITTDPSKAFRVVVNASDFKGVHLVIPTNTDLLLCPSGADRSRETGLCTGSGARGTMFDLTGQPLSRTRMWFKEAGEVYSTATGSDGTFNLSIPPGSYRMEVSTLIDSEYFFLGWYDSHGGITTNPDDIHRVEIVDGNFTDIVITFPDTLENMLCPSGGHRSTVTGSCS